MTRKSIISILLLFCSIGIRAQTWEWISQSGGQSWDVNSDIAIDSDKNVYTCGYFQDTAVFGSDTVTVNVFKNVYLAKYDSSGNHEWVFSTGAGGGNYRADAVATDTYGNVFLVGYVEDSTSFNSNNIKGAFIAKFESDGVLVWAKEISNNIYTQCADIVCDALGNIIVIGRFSNTTTFDTSTLVSYGSADCYVAKYDASGVLIWINQLGSTGSDYVHGLAINDQGYCYLTGTAADTLFIGSDVIPGGVFFVSKIDLSGGYLWNIGVNSNLGYGFAQSISADNNGNTYLTGTYNGIFNLGNDTLPVTSNGNWNIFIAKINSAGSFLWSRGFGGIGADYGYGIDVDEQGSSYVCGVFTQTVSFDSIVFNSTQPSTSDVFIAKLDNAGQLNWAKQIVGIGNDVAYNLELDYTGDCYLAGSVIDTTYFDTIKVVSRGIYDEVVAKIGNPTVPLGLPILTHSIHVLNPYPNPGTNYITIEFGKNNYVYASLSIYNSLGQWIETIENIQGENVSISTKMLASGFYILQLSDANNVVAQGSFIIR